MSTSKKRRAARAWMHKVTAENRSRVEQVRSEVVNQLRRTGEKLAGRKEQVSYNTDGGMDVSMVIEKFPSIYEGPPQFVIPFPEALSVRDSLYGPAFTSMKVLRFRAIEHAFKVPIGHASSSELRWFTWEPDHGTPELEQRTSALFKGMGKLHYTLRLLEGIQSFWSGTTSCHRCGTPISSTPMGFSEVITAAKLVKECHDELRLRLGAFAPEDGLTDEARKMRYGFGRDVAGFRL